MRIAFKILVGRDSRRPVYTNCKIPTSPAAVTPTFNATLEWPVNHLCLFNKDFNKLKYPWLIDSGAKIVWV